MSSSGPLYVNVAANELGWVRLNLNPAIWGAIAGTGAAYIVRTWGAAVLRPYTIVGDSRNIAALAGELAASGRCRRLVRGRCC